MPQAAVVLALESLLAPVQSFLAFPAFHPVHPYLIKYIYLINKIVILSHRFQAIREVL
jgi:hypothetical protein